MCVYRGMDIGTAKPTAAERASVPHHLIDVVDPTEEFSVAQYLEAAERVAEEIAARGKQVLFVGGTALYLKALLRGLFSGPPADWKLRRELEEIARVEGVEALHQRLAEVDAAAAAKLHPNDVRRVIRALEVHAATGVPISRLQQQFDQGRAAAECRVFVLDWPREELDERIRRRVEAMFAAGLVDEVKGLLAMKAEGGGRKAEAESERIVNGLGRTAREALGYREVIEYLRGERDLAATIELVKLRTRQFAKRQMTWFRSLSECRWVPVSGELNAVGVADCIAQQGFAVESNLPS
jgi:tRNA dimethylallyltransferase